MEHGISYGGAGLDGKLESRLPLTCADPADIFID